MNIKLLLVNLGKLGLCVVAYMVGITLGGILATGLALQQPPMPEGFDASTAGLYMILESPLLALVLVGLSRSIAGSFWVRTLMLASLTWISNALNNQIEGSYFGNLASGFWFTIIVFLVPSILVAAAVALLFPPASKKDNLAFAVKSFFEHDSASGGIWRLAWARSSSCPYITFSDCSSFHLHANFIVKDCTAYKFRLWISCW